MNFNRKKIFLNFVTRICATVSLVTLNPLSQNSNADSIANSEAAILESAARAFAEAEARQYLTEFLNRNPPIQGVEGFGSKAMFALQLVLAADAFAKADNDQQKFAAARQGAAAYISYVYAANPAVGLIATAVVLAVSVIEVGVAGSYGRVILQMQKEILKSQLRINDLSSRIGMAHAKGFLVHVGELERVLNELNAVNGELFSNCAERARDFDALAGCMTLLVKSVVLQRQSISAVNRVLGAPDHQLALLVLTETMDKDDASDVRTTPFSSGEIKNAAAESRNRYNKFRDELSAQLVRIEDAYTNLQLVYRKQVVDVIFDSALNNERVLLRKSELVSQCLLDKNSIAQNMTNIIIKITAIEIEYRNIRRNPELLKEFEKTDKDTRSILESYFQRREVCPSIASDADLLNLSEILSRRFFYLNYQYK